MKFSCHAIASASATKILARKEKLKAFFLLNEHTLSERSALLPQYLTRKEILKRLGSNCETWKDAHRFILVLPAMSGKFECKM